MGRRRETGLGEERRMRKDGNWVGNRSVMGMGMKT